MKGITLYDSEKFPEYCFIYSSFVWQLSSARWHSLASERMATPVWGTNPVRTLGKWRNVWIWGNNSSSAIGKTRQCLQAKPPALELKNSGHQPAFLASAFPQLSCALHPTAFPYCRPALSGKAYLSVSFSVHNATLLITGVMSYSWS